MMISWIKLGKSDATEIFDAWGKYTGQYFDVDRTTVYKCSSTPYPHHDAYLLEIEKQIQYNDGGNQMIPAACICFALYSEAAPDQYSKVISLESSIEELMCVNKHLGLEITERNVAQYCWLVLQIANEIDSWKQYLITDLFQLHTFPVHLPPSSIQSIETIIRTSFELGEDGESIEISIKEKHSLLFPTYYEIHGPCMQGQNLFFATFRVTKTGYIDEAGFSLVPYRRAGHKISDSNWTKSAPRYVMRDHPNFRTLIEATLAKRRGRWSKVARYSKLEALTFGIATLLVLIATFSSGFLYHFAPDMYDRILYALTSINGNKIVSGAICAIGAIWAMTLMFKMAIIIGWDWVDRRYPTYVIGSFMSSFRRRMADWTDGWKRAGLIAKIVFTWVSQGIIALSLFLYGASNTPSVAELLELQRVGFVGSVFSVISQIPLIETIMKASGAIHYFDLVAVAEGGRCLSASTCNAYYYGLFELPTRVQSMVMVIISFCIVGTIRTLLAVAKRRMPEY